MINSRTNLIQNSDASFSDCMSEPPPNCLARYILKSFPSRVNFSGIIWPNSCLVLLIISGWTDLRSVGFILNVYHFQRHTLNADTRLFNSFINMVVNSEIRDFHCLDIMGGCGSGFCFTVMCGRLKTGCEINTISKLYFPVSFQNVRQVELWE